MAKRSSRPPSPVSFAAFLFILTLSSIILILLLSSLSMISGKSMGATWTVSSQPEDEADFEKIGQAILNANPGDTIEVKSGVYNENIEVILPLTIRGAEVGMPLIDGNGYRPTILISAPNCTIETLNIEGAGIRNLMQELL